MVCVIDARERYAVARLGEFDKGMPSAVVRTSLKNSPFALGYTTSRGKLRIRARARARASVCT